MKKRNSNRIRGFVSVIFILILISMAYGCQSQMKQVVYYHNDNHVIEKYSDKLYGVISTEYEEVTWGEYIGILHIYDAPDPHYRGVVNITEEEGKRLTEDYLWRKNTGGFPDLGQIAKSVNLTGDWYVSEQFTTDAFSGVHDAVVLFDGKDKIIYEFGTY